jgi:hypothetical protein
MNPLGLARLPLPTTCAALYLLSIASGLSTPSASIACNSDTIYVNNVTGSNAK